jgi:exopolyphosphatase/guanosine-5'-triphosphate,3'-diphosphate pyrophosphatase
MRNSKTMIQNSTKVAAIGIGSNSVRLLIAERTEGRLSALERLQTVTRLASFRRVEGEEPLLTDESIGKTWATAAGFARHAREQRATLVGVVAAEAVRVAANRDLLTDALERELGVPVTLISGEEEATLGWRAISMGYEPSAPVGVIDIGGGSTDLSVGVAGALEPTAVESLKVGSRTLTQRFGLDGAMPQGQVAGVLDALRAEYGNRVAAMRPNPESAIVIGGTADVLAALRRHSLENEGSTGAPVERSSLARWLERAALLDPGGRANLGVPADRADIIVAGAVILLAVLDAWGLSDFQASQRNILDGFIAEHLGLHLDHPPAPHGS